MAEEEKRFENDEKPIKVELSEAIKLEAVEITETTLEESIATKSPSTTISQHSKNEKTVEIKNSKVRENPKEENEKEIKTQWRSRSKCRSRSRDPRHCQKHFREMIGKHESRNDQLERRESDLRKRLEILECSVPAVTVWNIWRMSQGAPISSIQRVIEKQFKGPIEERKIFPTTPSQHYDCRVREVEAERKEAQRRAEEARELWAQKEAALGERKRKIEEARKAHEDRGKEVARLEQEATEARKALEKAKGDDTQCTEGECGEIKCREVWLNKIGSATSIRSTDLECLTRLQELAEAELELKRQICELERREYAYMKTLEEADVMWAKMKGDAESSVDSLHEQLEAKIIANQELAGRTCQLEDELERMRKQLSAAHSQIKKLKDVKGQDAASGYEDDFAGTVSRDVTAETDQTDKSTKLDDLVHLASKDVNAVPDQLDRSVGRANDFAPVTSRHTTAAPDKTDKNVTAVPDQTDQATVPESDLIKVSDKKVTVRPNQTDQLSGRETGHVTSSDIAVQGVESSQPRTPKDIASGRPNDYAKVVDAAGTVNQEGIDNAQLLIDMYADDYGACAPDFVCNDQVLSPFGMPLDKDDACPPDFQCENEVSPKTKKPEFTETIRPQPISIGSTSSNRPDFVPAVGQAVGAKIKEDTSEVQEGAVGKLSTKEPKSLRDEVMDEYQLNTEYLDEPGESTGSTGTSKDRSPDVPRDEVISPRGDYDTPHDGTLGTQGVNSISKRDDDDTEIERDTVKRVDITEEGFSGENVAEPTGKPVVDLAEVQEGVTSDGVLKNIEPQVESVEGAFLPIAETIPVAMTPAMTPEPEFPSDVESEIPFEDAVDTPLQLEGEVAEVSTTKVWDQDAVAGVPRDGAEIEKKAETGNAASLPETEFRGEFVRDTEPSRQEEELITQNVDSGRPYDEVKEERLSKQADSIEEDKSSDAGPEVKVVDKTVLISGKEIKSKDVEKDGESLAVEVDEKVEVAAAEFEKETVATKAEMKSPARADDIEEKKIAEKAIEPKEDEEASETVKIYEADTLPQEVEKLSSLEVMAEVEPSEVKEEEPRVTADESEPKSLVTDKPTELIDEIKVMKPTLVEDKPDMVTSSKVTAEIEPSKVEPSKVEPSEVEPPKVKPPEVKLPQVEPPKVEPSKIEPSKVKQPEVEQFEIKEEEPSLAAHEFEQKSQEYKPTEPIDKMKLTKPTFAKNKMVYDKTKRKTSIPIMSPTKDACICKPRTCPLEASRSIKQSPDKPRVICPTMQQRPGRISKIAELFGESKLRSTIRDRKHASPDSYVRRLRWRGTLRNQSTLTTIGVATQTDTYSIRKSKPAGNERHKADLPSGLCPENLQSPSCHKSSTTMETTTIFIATGKSIRPDSSDGTDQVLCYSCEKPIAQRTSVSIKKLPSMTREKVKERDTDSSSTRTNMTSEFLCCDCDSQATGEKGKIKKLVAKEKANMSKESQSASYQEKICRDSSISIEDKCETRTKVDPTRKRKPETKDYGCLVKIPRVKPKIPKNNKTLESIKRPKKREKLRQESCCSCIEKSTTSFHRDTYKNI